MWSFEEGRVYDLVVVMASIPDLENTREETEAVKLGQSTI